MTIKTKSTLKIVFGIILVLVPFPGLITGAFLVLGGILNGIGDPQKFGEAVGMFVGPLIILVLGAWLTTSGFKQRRQIAATKSEASM